MKIILTARHFKASEDLKQYINKEVSQLSKYNENIIECDVVLIKEKNNCETEISLKVPHEVLTVKESSENFYTSIDQAMHNLERKIQKHKEKSHSYSHQKINDLLLPS